VGFAGWSNQGAAVEVTEVEGAATMSERARSLLMTPRRELALRFLIVAGLAIDAYVHIVLADVYDAVGSPVTQGALFRGAAALAMLSALLVIALPGRATYLLAIAVAGSALGAVLVYRYVDVGALGFLPDMYEPGWYGAKTLSAVGEATALAAAAALLRHRSSMSTSACGSRAGARTGLGLGRR
jgi:hypothetical protein